VIFDAKIGTSAETAGLPAQPATCLAA